MEVSKILRTVLIILFIIFIALFISQANGYYEYQEYKKVALTKDQIREFESDIRAGKKIDLKDYVGKTKKEYGNTISDVGLKFSKKIEKYVKKTINASFGALSKLVNEDN